MRKQQPRVYNDGVCYIVEDQTTPSSFAAKRTGQSAYDYRAIFRLMFAEMSIREQDLEFAEANSRTLNRKIKTPRVQGWNSTHKIIIENTLYDIVNADIDRAKSEIYFYLEEVRQLVIE